MITLVVNGRGDPMLLSLSECLVESGMWCKWHWNWLPTPEGMFGSDTSQGGIGQLGYSVPKQSCSCSRCTLPGNSQAMNYDEYVL